MNSAMTDQTQMLALLTRWSERNWLREVDLALVRFFVSETPDIDPALMLATALASHQLGRGHVCLDLGNTLDDPYMALSLPPDNDELAAEEKLPQPAELLAGWTLSDWLTSLENPDLVGDGDGNTPLVLAGQRLYLRRYWRHERQVESAIRARLDQRSSIAEKLPEAAFKETLNELFPATGTGQTDWQKIACALAAGSAFSVITGGPGTGKTTTVVRLLALLQRMALAADPARPLAIRLAAPTGKAAARLKESIGGAIDKLPAFVQDDPRLKAAIPDTVTTLHRLLGTRPDSRRFRHDARNPLPLDVLVVDEGSMVDLEMMAAMLAALPAHARLVLLGDKDQLASVEAGSVLGELCRRAREGHFQPQLAAWMRAMTGESIPDSLQDEAGQALDQHIVMLRESHRFAAASGIGQLAGAVNAGDSMKIQAVWAKAWPDIRRHDLAGVDAPELAGILLGPEDDEGARQGLAGYLKRLKQRPEITASQGEFDQWAADVLRTHGRFQLLCALRNGPFGVDGMNRRIEALLARRRLIQPQGAWYEGRPVLVTRNDYSLGLMNGDIGIALPHPVRNRTAPAPDWGLRVAFPRNDGSNGIHWVLPSRLLAVETVFALTVHKSQGSEFEHCALLLPPERNPVLTRELVYTGITRGKKWFSVICIGNPGIVDAAAARTVQRSGGLFA